MFVWTMSFSLSAGHNNAVSLCCMCLLLTLNQRQLNCNWNIFGDFVFFFPLFRIKILRGHEKKSWFRYYFHLKSECFWLFSLSHSEQFENEIKMKINMTKCWNSWEYLYICGKCDRFFHSFTLFSLRLSLSLYVCAE